MIDDATALHRAVLEAQKARKKMRDAEAAARDEDTSADVLLAQIDAAGREFETELRNAQPAEAPVYPMSPETLKFAQSLGAMAAAVGRTGKLEARIQELAREQKSLRAELAHERESKRIVDLDSARAYRDPDSADAGLPGGGAIDVVRDGEGRLHHFAVDTPSGVRRLEARRDRLGRVHSLSEPSSKRALLKVTRDANGRIARLEIPRG